MLERKSDPLPDRVNGQAPVPSLRRRADGRLWLAHAGRAQPVRLVRCFPWSAPDHHASLRDDDEQEVF